MLLTDSDLTLLEVDTLCSRCILLRLPLRHGLRTIRLGVEEVHRAFGSECSRRHRDFMRVIRHIPLSIVNSSADHSSVEVEGRVFSIIVLLSIDHFRVKACRSKVHREVVTLACVIEVARAGDSSAPLSINATDADSTSDEDIVCIGIDAARHGKLDTSLMAIADLLNYL